MNPSVASTCMGSGCRCRGAGGVLSSTSRRGTWRCPSRVGHLAAGPRRGRLHAPVLLLPPIVVCSRPAARTWSGRKSPPDPAGFRWQVSACRCRAISGGLSSSPHRVGSFWCNTNTRHDPPPEPAASQSIPAWHRVPKWARRHQAATGLRRHGDRPLDQLHGHTDGTPVAMAGVLRSPAAAACSDPARPWKSRSPPSVGRSRPTQGPCMSRFNSASNPAPRAGQSFPSSLLFPDGPRAARPVVSQAAAAPPDRPPDRPPAPAAAAPPLPATGFLRQPQVLLLVPVSKSTLWRRVQDQTFPQPVRLVGRITVWRVEDVHRWIAQQGGQP